MSPSWYAAFAPAEAPLRCGEAEHRLRWVDGTLRAVDHADAEGELVLAALGGDTSPCLDVVRAWGRHSDDLTVLMVGPRSPVDAVTIPAAALQEADLLRSAGHAAASVAHVHTFYAHSRPRRLVRRSSGWSGYRPLVSRSFAGRAGIGWSGPDVGQDRLERLLLLRLLALGAPFQLRLAAAVAQSWSADGEHAAQAERARPALTAALTGRVAPAAAQWLGIDPDEVDATIYDGTGWGEMTGVRTDANARLVAKLPVAWLSRVWAPGFAVVGSHLVVAVLRVAWPHARVIALRSPGQDPVELSIRQDEEHWSVTSR